MPDFAKHIEVTREGRSESLRIDGQECPWYVGKTIVTEPTEAQHRARKAEAKVAPTGCTCNEPGGCCSDCPKAPAQTSMVDAAKLSLNEAERWEAQAEDDDPDISPRRRMRDELLLANAQASIAVAEALERSERATEPDEDREADVTTDAREISLFIDGREFDAAVRRVAMSP